MALSFDISIVVLSAYHDCLIPGSEIYVAHCITYHESRLIVVSHEAKKKQHLCVFRPAGALQ